MGFKVTAAAVLLLVLAVTGNVSAQPAPKNYRSKNGLRLVGSSGSRGRIEVNSKDAWFAPEDGKGGWSAVCDDGFTDTDAQTMCELLGYSYGRKYYDPKVNYRKTQSPNRMVGKLTCSPRTEPSAPEDPPPSPKPSPRPSPKRSSPPPSPVSSPPTYFSSPPPAVASSRPSSKGRRLLRAAEGDEALQSSGDKVGGVARRSVFSPLTGSLAAPTKAPYTCTLSAGACDSTGPLAAIECSHEVPSPAPPPPPRPPMPPPAPPAPSSYIRLIGGQMLENDNGNVEPNLCPSDDYCYNYGRVELLVPSPANGSAKVWAPVCSPSPADPAYQNIFYIGVMVCQQVYDWPKTGDSGVETVVSDVADPGFTIPTGNVGKEGHFNPAAYSAWVNVVAVDFDQKTIQDSNPMVTANPCESGQLLAVRCTAWS